MKRNSSPQTLEDFECYNILMPKSKGSCRIDLIIPNNFNKLFGNKDESWTPFPEWTKSPSQYLDGYQRKVGKWVDDFIEEYDKQEFSLSAYIGEEYQNTAYFLETLVLED